MSATIKTPSLVEQIEEYIRQHSLWKINILAAIKSGRSEHNPADVAVDNKCAFGKWLYSADAQMTSHAEYEQVRMLHATFHAKAARTLADALAGRKEQAIKDLEAGDFSAASSELILAMARWKKSLK